ncbi:hypothetical protein [Embleya sp. NBC_00896]|uniref:hypothetical protein n=1 Tax=Embleya sp. NBC_00896 TaxID=2975961 RepID=UPI002F9142E2|nr:hypothetical protein OG928_42445 [Embleya sp. NBC_00896]
MRILAEPFAVRAYIVIGEERTRPRKTPAPAYHAHQARTRRVIPIVVPERGRVGRR